MQVTIEIKTLLQAIQTHNPDADLTGLKAYLFDLMLDPELAPAPAPRPARAARRPAPVAEAVAQAAADEAPQYNKYAEDLSPHAPAQPLKPETFDLEGEGGDPVTTLAQKAVGSVSPSPAPKVAKGKASIKDRKAQREAKRKEVANFANMTSKEIMEQLTSRTLPKKKEGQNQFIDLGEEDQPASGDIEMG